MTMRFFKSPLAGTLVYLAAVCFLVILGSTDAWEEIHEALRVPSKAIWCSLVAVQVTVWAFVIAPCYRRARKFSNQIRQHRGEVLCDIAALLVLLTILINSRYIAIPPDMVLFQKPKMAVISVFGALTVLPSLLGGRLVSFEAASAAASGDAVNVLARLEELRGDLRWFLTAASGVVAGATLTRGALHGALLFDGKVVACGRHTVVRRVLIGSGRALLRSRPCGLREFGARSNEPDNSHAAHRRPRVDQRPGAAG
jgi:hypothetical protein